MSAKISITGEMSQKVANKVKTINSLANFILKIGIASSALIVSFSYFYSQVLK
ncbi:hypothetical protein [Acinetobacter bereziniae]|uniref:Uncharacterized protein n=1 Tax=Acinetobacter bereziniae NIPH 3 TaxID=1217651 RepID=N8YNW1_ACIBZ|nr:hypothetical protein [Acinetobacter bereziniae]ENV20950.1 hypothetical protein F963_03081 [Acinetobacter bereziniae NIPH 3]MDR6542978.1 hypothetical protein [Acinetobacter bereziniae]